VNTDVGFLGLSGVRRTADLLFRRGDVAAAAHRLSTRGFVPNAELDKPAMRWMTSPASR
jgi:hypothetical protein